MGPDTIYFVSDAHLGAPFPDAPEWERSFLGFLGTLPGRATALYVLGDLFDFWIEYPGRIRPDYAAVAGELGALVKKGIAVHYFAGNHDFALGPYFTRTMGIAVYPGQADTVLQGKRVLLFHGDGLLREDTGYRVLARLLRNRTLQWLYKLLPMRIGVAIGSFFSGTSRKYGEGFMTEKRVAEYRTHARAYLDKGSDIVMFAHTHKPELSCWGDKWYCNTGAWMRKCTFATMQAGKVRLWRYRAGADPEEVPPGPCT